MKVRVDRDACVGHGRCYVLAPDVFEDDDRGHCVVRRPDLPAGLEKQARSAVDNCPEGALHLDDDPAA